MKWLILVFLALVIAFSGCTQRTVETTTTTSITTIFTTTTINEINTSGGFILTGEALKVVAEDVAKLKKWDVLIVNTSNPIEIRKQIVSFTEHKNYEYMLILGDDNIIPIEKDGILDKKYLPNEELQNALDELFYGNIDNDDFVELSVGRIPLNNKDQIMNYYEHARDSFEYDAQIFDYVSIGSFTTGVIKSGYDGDATEVKENPSKTLFLDTLKTHPMTSIYTHGNKNTIALNDNEMLTVDEIPDLSNAPLVFASACSASRGFGIKIMEKGATAYVGFYSTATPNPTIMPLFNEETISKSIKEDVNQYIALSEAGLIEPGGFPSMYVLYGDPSIKMSQKKSEFFKAINEDGAYKINIPQFRIIDNFEGKLGSAIAVSPYYLKFTYYRNAIETLGSGKYYEFIGRQIVPFSQLLNDDSIPSSEGRIVESGFFIPLDENDAYFSDSYPRILSSYLDTYYKYILSEKNLAKILSPYDSAVYYPANGDAITYVFHVDESMPIKEAYWLIGNERIDLSQSASVKVINGETERYLVIRQPVQDIFKIIAQGGLVKGHSIVVVT